MHPFDVDVTMQLSHDRLEALRRNVVDLRARRARRAARSRLFRADRYASEPESS